MDFNTITTTQEEQAKSTFREYGLGVVMGNYTTQGQSKWEELVDPEIFSIRDIRNKMLNIGSRINTMCNDELLGDTSVAFEHVTERDITVKVTWLDIYTFLRAVYRHRIETQEYKDNKRRVQELQKFIDSNKSVDDKLREAEDELKKLQHTM